MKYKYLLVAMGLTLLIPAAVFSKAEKGKPPVQLAANVINSNTVKLTWMGTQKDYAYRLRVRPVGVLTRTLYNIAAPTCTRRITDLLSSTAYQWQVQTLYGKSPKDTSGFVSGPNFTPWEPCDAPNGLMTMVDGVDEAALIWVPVGDQVRYKVNIRPEGTDTWTTYVTDKNVLMVTNLKVNQGYEWTVKAQCKQSGLDSETSDKSFFAASPNVMDNTPIGNYGYAGQVLTFDATNDVIEATLQNHLGQRVEKLPVYYTASNGTVAFNVANDLPPGLYNIAYCCGNRVESKTILIAER